MNFSGLPIFGEISTIFTFFLFLVLTLNLFSLPANWIIIGIIALWNYLLPFSHPLSFWQWAVLIALALLGEVLETFFQLYKARKYGSSTSGTFASLIGAILGALLLSPIFWGLGAIIGALLGAWLACFAMERLTGKKTAAAVRAAYGSMLGRFLGMANKIGLGILIIILASKWLGPNQSNILKNLAIPQEDEILVIHKKCSHYPLWHPFS